MNLQIEDKIVKFVNYDYIHDIDDPILILKYFHLYCEYNKIIDGYSLFTCVINQNKLKELDRTILNYEFFKILNHKNSYKSLKLMSKIGILDKIVGPHNILNINNKDFNEDGLLKLYALTVFNNKCLIELNDIFQFSDQEFTRLKNIKIFTNKNINLNEFVNRKQAIDSLIIAKNRNIISKEECDNLITKYTWWVEDENRY